MDKKMKTIGLLGGMSWESTSEYYRQLNDKINHRLGGLHSARIVMISVDFAPLEVRMQKGDWAFCAAELVDNARKIAMAGADFLLICTNTMHILAPEIARAIDIPLIHIADATAGRILQSSGKQVGLLGTRFTMEESFYRERLQSHGLEVIVPDAADRQIIDRVIFEELCKGRIEETSRQHYLRVIDWCKSRGADSIIAGCTEIAMLVRPEDCPLPLYDTTAIHVDKAVQLALDSNPVEQSVR